VETWPARVFIGMSEQEAGPENPERSREYVDAAHELALMLGRRGVHVEIVIGPGLHNEQAWAERLPEALEFLFGK
jgi:hypothetical protein